MPPWLIALSFYQNKESKLDSAKWVQLATLSLDKTPRVRTVVFRGWNSRYEMKLLTDRRSSKIKELEYNNNVEVCWLFLESKCQFRFRGTSYIDISNDSSHHWKQLDEQTKFMWSWPYPGEKFIDDKINLIEQDTQKSDNFVLLNINIEYAEQLLLEKPVHIRKKWIKNKNWIEERINP